jgi:hypothetical protein
MSESQKSSIPKKYKQCLAMANNFANEIGITRLLRMLKHLAYTTVIQSSKMEKQAGTLL